MYGIGINIYFFLFSVPRNGSWPYINWIISLNSIIFLWVSQGIPSLAWYLKWLTYVYMLPCTSVRKCKCDAMPFCIDNNIAFYTMVFRKTSILIFTLVTFISQNSAELPRLASRVSNKPSTLSPINAHPWKNAWPLGGLKDITVYYFILLPV